MKRILLALSLCVLSTTAFSEVETYSIDNTHSFANFTIRHVVSKTSGTFPDIKGVITIDRNDLAKSSVEAHINVMSVNTSHATRDKRITSKPEYLDAEKFGQMIFTSTSVEAKSNDAGIMHGQLTLHGITKAISFPFKVLGFGAGPWGGNRSGFEGHTTLNAADYGFGWATTPEGPIGNEIEITLLIEGVKTSADFKPW